MTFTNAEVAQDYLKRLERERGEMPFWYHFFKFNEEAGEIHREFLRWQGLHRSGRVGQDKFAEELADAVITLYAIADMYTIDLDAQIQKKHTVLMTRSMKEE